MILNFTKRISLVLSLPKILSKILVNKYVEFLVQVQNDLLNDCSALHAILLCNSRIADKFSILSIPSHCQIDAIASTRLGNRTVNILLPHVFSSMFLYIRVPAKQRNPFRVIDELVNISLSNYCMGIGRGENMRFGVIWN